MLVYGQQYCRTSAVVNSSFESCYIAFLYVLGGASLNKLNFVHYFHVDVMQLILMVFMQ